jgi:hypothetical protein
MTTSKDRTFENRLAIPFDAQIDFGLFVQGEDKPAATTRKTKTKVYLLCGSAMNTLVDVDQKRTKVFLYSTRRYMWLGVPRRWPLDHIASAQGLASLHQNKTEFRHERSDRCRCIPPIPRKYVWHLCEQCLAYTTAL